MEITKRRLIRIIKEEKQKLQEVEYHGSSGALGDLEGLFKQVLGVLSSIDDPMERNAEIYILIDELEELASKA